MKLLIDTGVFSAAVSELARPDTAPQVELLAGNQLFLAAATVAELRYGALVANWGTARRLRLERAIEATTVVPVSDRLLTTVASFRFECRLAGHPLANRIHGNDLWIASSALHIDAALVTADKVFVAAPGLRLA